MRRGKKWIALIAASCLLIPSVRGVYAEELTDGEIFEFVIEDQNLEDTTLTVNSISNSFDNEEELNGLSDDIDFAAENLDDGGIEYVTASQGNCGDNLTWNLTESTLKISGEGDMYDYDQWNDEYAPWYNVRHSIKYVEIESGISSIGNYAFTGCTSLQTVVLNNSLKSIGEGAFYGCRSLNNITIPKTLTEIKWGTFYGCTGLTSVIIPEGVKRIGEYAFYYCVKLEDVTIPVSVTEIDEGAFGDCDGLKNIYYYGSDQQWKAIAIGAENASISDAEIQNNDTKVVKGEYKGHQYQIFDNCGSWNEAAEFCRSQGGLSCGYR